MFSEGVAGECGSTSDRAELWPCLYEALVFWIIKREGQGRVCKILTTTRFTDRL